MLHHILPKALEALKTGWVLPKLILIMWLTKRFDVCVFGSDVCQTRGVVWKVCHVPVLWIPPEGLQEHPEKVLEHTRRRKARPVTFWNKGSSFQREQTSVFWEGITLHPNFPLSASFITHFCLLQSLDLKKCIHIQGKYFAYSLWMQFSKQYKVVLETILKVNII